MYFIIATVILSTGISSGAIDNISFKNKSQCESYISHMGYTNSNVLKFKCVKEDRK